MTQNNAEGFSFEEFEGWDIPESNFFRLPNTWITIMAKMTSLAELKVVLYVLRHTWGYQEFGIAKLITTDEFMHGRKREDGSRLDPGTGLSNRSVIDGLRSAVEHGLLVEEIDDRDRARIKKYYALRMRTNGAVDNIQSDVKNLHSGVKKVHSSHEQSSQRSEKDTLERHLQKDTPSKFEGSTPKQGRGGKASTKAEKEKTESAGSEDITTIVNNYTNQVLHDIEHLQSNVTQTLNLWHESGLAEDEFIDLLAEAKRLTLKYSGSIKKQAGNQGLKNRAPYFFQILKDLIGKKRTELLYGR